MYDVEVGAYYFLSGVTSDDKVRVIDIDKSERRVKIYNPNTEEVDWVNASSLITRSESRERDLNRIKTAAEVIKWMLKPSSTSGGSSANLASETDNTGGFKVTNNCSHPVRVAIHFKDLSGNWRTEGWWAFDSGESSYLSDAKVRLKTRNATWYYYAEGVNDKNLVWKGDHVYKDIPMVELTDEDGDSDWTLTCNGYINNP